MSSGGPLAGGAGLVEAADRGGDGRCVDGVGVGLGLAGDPDHRVAELVQRLLRLRLGGLDHERLLDDQREVDRRGVEAEVEEPLGDVGGRHKIIASVKNGIYAVYFGGGQVDITSGKYVFQCTEAYRIEGGKVGAPLKGAMLIGNGPTDLHRVSMIGNDLALDTGIGTCGKNGQGVPVGVGQPTLRMDRITVGGTA